MGLPTPKKATAKPILPMIAALLVAGVIAWLKYSGKVPHEPSASPASMPTRGNVPVVVDETSLQRAIATHQSDVVVQGSGKVVKLLPDDTEGDRHQRLLIEVGPGRTILLAHNIDVARRIDARAGDSVSFKGEFVWNERGGVVHWTHHDPRRKHPDGWVRIGERTFD